ncbi:dehydrogenase/reductase SDR family member 4-like [Mauremys mutica]|uniref:dehydrogenase/reductase SDR family member 4-like n=1 Tax=Mauremys mutica TaxID=74926 RepID=UPI001D160D71|nr:dehydrogenase/reductase SDR family member 4-like [Mauremys mutica]
MGTAGALERHGGIDTLVSNAGVNPFLRSTLDASEDVRNKLWKEEAVKEKMLKNLRVKRLGVPSDCAGIVSFLCSPDASYITGETPPPLSPGTRMA